MLKMKSIFFNFIVFNAYTYQAFWKKNFQHLLKNMCAHNIKNNEVEKMENPIYFTYRYLPSTFILKNFKFERD